jgi:hypothetical protein
MVAQIERGQRLYIADETDRIFEGALLDVNMASGVVQLDPIAELTLDSTTKRWTRTTLPKGPARSAPFAIVHDEENEARYYAARGYTSPLADPGSWSHPSKRVWLLTTERRFTDAWEGMPTAAPTTPPVTVEVFTTRVNPRPNVAAEASDDQLAPEQAAEA